MERDLLHFFQVPSLVITLLSVSIILFFFFYPFETGSYYIALGELEFAMEIRVVLNSWSSVCLCLPCVGIISGYYHTSHFPPTFTYFYFMSISVLLVCIL